ncbi:hypothetical protein BGX34_004280 [Mortierella sp. NVP85]|nr:hypothetical protein BGX34_004280 [Mortierella sp. NVP85]
MQLSDVEGVFRRTSSPWSATATAAATATAPAAISGPWSAAVSTTSSSASAATASSPWSATASSAITTTATAPVTVSVDVYTVNLAAVIAAVEAAASVVISGTTPVTASSAAPAPAPVPAVAPDAVAARRGSAAEEDRIAHFFGSEVIKLFLGVLTFIQYPEHDAGQLTKERRDHTAGIRRREDMNRTMGADYLYCGYSPALLDFALLHDLNGITSVDQYVDDYIDSLDEDDVDVGLEAPDLAQVKEIIDYELTNKQLLEEALTPPRNTRTRPNYERLEFFGDSVLGVIAAAAWIDRGNSSIESLGRRQKQSTTQL